MSIEGLKRLFGQKKEETGPDPLSQMTLRNLQKGYFLDYDMKTWEVTAYNYYEWGRDDITHEWQLKSHDETIYLERETDDEDVWAISRKIPVGRVGHDIIRQIVETDDPPDTIAFEGTTFYLEESGAGHFYKEGQGQGQGFVVWDYVDDSGKQLLSIEQWGEEEFEAALGEPVEEYQFSNILPREKTPT